VDGLLLCLHGHGGGVDRTGAVDTFAGYRPGTATRAAKAKIATGGYFAGYRPGTATTAARNPDSQRAGGG